MSEKRTSCKSFFAAHRGMAVLLAAELLCLLVLLARCFKPLYILRLDLAQLTLSDVQDNCTAAMQDDTLVIDTTGATETTEKEETEEAQDVDEALLTLTGPAVILPSDAYEVTVEYDSNRWRLDEKPIEISFENEGMAELFVGGTETYETKSEPQLALDGSHHSVTGRVWVNRGNTKGFAVQLRASMPAHTEIRSITFRAKRAYRILQLAAMIFLFAALDVFLALFFTDTGIGREEKESCARRKKIFLLLAGICLTACLPFTSGLEYPGDDFRFHLERIAQVAAELHNGQFPVRMMTRMLNGYGYANSLYYCDLFLYLPAVLYNCMVPLGICYNIYAAAVTVCTCLLTYYSLRKISSARAACIGTAIYLLSGYRLVNVFMRSAVGEYTAMAFLPLVAVHVYLMYTKEDVTWHEWVPLAVGMACLVQCHLLTFEVVCLILGIFAVVFWRKTFRKKRLTALLKAAGAALGLCAWFLVPLLQSMLTQNVQINGTYVHLFQEYGTSLLYLLNPFPVSVLSYMNRRGAVDGDFTVYLNTLHGIHGVLGAPLLGGLALALYMLFHRKSWDAGRKSAPLRVIMLLAVLMMVFSLRQFPWNTLFTYCEGTILHKLLGTLQFPWRYLSVAAVLISVGAAVALDEFEKWKKGRAKAVGAVLVAICFLYAGSFFVYFGVSPERITYTATNADSVTIMSGEYKLPNGPEPNYARPRTESTDLQVKYYDKINGVAYATLENTGAESAALTLPIYDYGNYVVTDDTGAAWPTETSKDSLLEVSVPAGFAGGITVRYREPVLWRIMEIVSAATLAATVFGCLTQRQKEKTTAQQA